MRSCAWTAADRGVFSGLLSGRIFMLLAVFAFAFAVLPASGQTNVNPTTNTIQISGPNQAPANTNPLGGIVLYGSAISSITGRPVRHLWVSDSQFAVCRMDPELDAPGPLTINSNTCQYAINRQGGAIPLGGPFAFDPAHNFLYFTDNNTASQGVIRIVYNPTLDNGQGMIDITKAFTLAGGQFTRKGPFAGGTGCPYPGPAINRARPNGVALSPLGDLWVGFSDGPEILRINSPATADQGFGSCDQLVQVVAISPDNASTFGLAFIGHDLWSGDANSPFVIPSADTTCLVPPFGACTTANGTVVPTLPGIGETAGVAGDQVYPATNGNNLYIAPGTIGAGAGTLTWVGNVAGGTAGQTLDVNYLTPTNISPSPDPAMVAFCANVVDATDPANEVSYVADDPLILINNLAIGGGRWWKTTRPIDVNGTPDAPQHVVAVAGESQISLSWSPAQSAVPVTSYTVRNTFVSAGSPIADITVNPASPNDFPPTSIVIPGLTDTVSYAFEVQAHNGSHDSAFSDQSNEATPPGFGVPGAPTNVIAQPGDAQALVTWTVPASNGGQPITSYTVTVLTGGVATGATVTVPPPPAGSNTDSAVVTGLTNNTAYTFTVHATNIAGAGPESAPSAPVTPTAGNLPVPTMTISGPTTEKVTPVQNTYTITVTNSSSFPIDNVTLTETLNAVPDNIALISRDKTGLVSVSLATNEQYAPNEQVTIAGVSDASFDGTFTILNTPTASTFTYQQANIGAVSSNFGTSTLLPAPNIMSVQTGQGTCTAGGPGVFTFSCDIGLIEPGAVVRIPFIVQMQNQTIKNSAILSGSDSAGTALANVTASITTLAPAGTSTNTTTDLQLSGSAKNGGPTVTGTLPAGAPDTYNWQIRNATANVAGDVVFTQTLPPALVFESVTTDLPVDLGFCSGPAPGTAGGTVTCNSANLGGSRQNGAKPVQQFNVVVNVNVVQTGSIGSSGNVTFAGTDTNAKNNSVLVTINAK
ncbi:MAG TPA: fibronectin type III domain-containing protein [Candidatus Angelobacter sp.]|nr:fibronectin type III domain-containing protein [Candidatus Angelobacter sp.]